MDLVHWPACMYSYVGTTHVCGQKKQAWPRSTSSIAVHLSVKIPGESWNIRMPSNIYVGQEGNTRNCCHHHHQKNVLVTFLWETHNQIWKEDVRSCSALHYCPLVAIAQKDSPFHINKHECVQENVVTCLKKAQQNKKCFRHILRLGLKLFNLSTCRMLCQFGYELNWELVIFKGPSSCKVNELPTDTTWNYHCTKMHLCRILQSYDCNVKNVFESKSRSRGV